MSISYNDIIPWGRSLEEYMLMFNLTGSDLGKKILGVGDGPASFNCEMLDLGYQITSVDPIYAYSTDEIKARIDATYNDVLKQTEENKEKFVWSQFRDVEHLGNSRMGAMYLFLADYAIGKEEGRYIEAELPKLPFEDGEFDLILVSHLLFLYSENLDANFHLEAIKELCRVGKEVRIFPLLDLNGETSEHLPSVYELGKAMSWKLDLLETGYEFQKGGTACLKITPKNV